ncbi:MAG TPA: hypothetical protein VF784_00575 [Anaerolineales bacterium]
MPDDVSLQLLHNGQPVRTAGEPLETARAAEINELEIETWAFNTKAQEFFKAAGLQPKIERLWMHLDE